MLLLEPATVEGYEPSTTVRLFWAKAEIPYAKIQVVHVCMCVNWCHVLENVNIVLVCTSGQLSSRHYK